MQTNTIIHAPNTEHLQTLPEASVDLIYCDPPFNTSVDYASQSGGYSDNYSEAPDRNRLQELAFSWLYPVTTYKQQCYFAEMIPIIELCHRILKPTGTLYWHTDYRTTAWFRLILNQIFGQNNYRNEIVWGYNTTMPFDSIKHRWKNNHDTIQMYAKSEKATFHGQFYPLKASEIKERYPHKDAKGQRYRYTQGAGKVLTTNREYASENRGTRIGTSWTDIGIATPNERTGYPTQKPVRLLKRIIRASSNENDIVLDPFCGSGTTLIAAKQLNRQWIGIDQNAEAVEVAKRRLKCS